ncbi:MAG: CRTAC1 family protein [Acidobacteriia bacterium]|nr:CRTAC1 family protein [Terriglobia bacterium]
MSLHRRLTRGSAGRSGDQPHRNRSGHSLFLGLVLAGAAAVCGVATFEHLLAQANQAPPISIPVRFTDIRQAAGITWREDGTPTEEKNYLETMGTGLAWIDYDQDGLLDLYLVQAAATEWYTPPQPLYSALYHNNGDGTFTDVTKKAGVGAERLYGQGVAVGDYDNDGYPDLYVMGYGRAILYHNNGDGTFTDVTEKAGVADRGQWSSSAAFFDYDRDGHLDLVVCNYLQWTAETNIWCGEKRPGYRAYCHPDNYRGQKLALFHNNGDGTFTNVSEKSGLGAPEAKGLGIVAVDLTNDGWPDIFVANDTWPNFLFINNRDGTFRDVSYTSGVAASEDGKYEAGMGTDSADVDGDGWFDLYVTHLDFELNRLYHNNHDETFDDVTYYSRIGTKASELSGVSMKFLDYDNDGWSDICQANGAMVDNVQLYHSEVTYPESKLMFRNLGQGKFEKVSELLGPDFMRPTVGRGLAVGDFDNDGDLDIAIINRDDYIQFLRNDGGNANHWLEVKLVGTKAARDGTGAALKLVSEGFTQYQQAKGGMSYMSAHDQRIHFGLGQRKTIDSLEITWLSGTVDKLTNVPIDQIITVKEGAGITPRHFPRIPAK